MKRSILMSMTALLLAGAMSGCGTAGTSGASGSSTASVAPAPSDFDTASMITVVSREDGSGTRGAFIELMGIQEKKDDGSKVDMTTKEAIIANKTDVMLTNVAGDPFAIGYVSLGSLGESVKALEIDGAAASAENVKSGTYKVARPFNIATNGEASGVGKDFIEYIMSAEGQAIVEKAGYIKIVDNAPTFAGGKEAGKLVIAGSSSVAPVMEKLKEAYLALNTSATIEIQQSDSTAGMTAVAEGTCDIGMASRELKESELAGLTGLAIANDGIAIIVSPSNPQTVMTSEQVKAVFTGAATTWAEAQ